jgi:hypothetical protein
LTTRGGLIEETGLTQLLALVTGTRIFYGDGSSAITIAIAITSYNYLSVGG